MSGAERAWEPRSSVATETRSLRRGKRRSAQPSRRAWARSRRSGFTATGRPLHRRDRPDHPAPRMAADQQQAAQHQSPVDPSQYDQAAEQLDDRPPGVVQHAENQLRNAAGVLPQEAGRAAGAAGVSLRRQAAPVPALRGQYVSSQERAAAGAATRSFARSGVSVLSHDHEG